MSTEVLADMIRAEVGDNASGQIAVGKHIVQIGDFHGVLIVPSESPEPASPRRRPAPVRLLPRPFPDLLDRESEGGAATQALQAGQLVSLKGEPGIGKTALARFLAYQPVADAFPGGVVYMPVRRIPAEDLLLELFDAFYEREPNVIPTDTQIRHALQPIRALVILDDLVLDREDVELLFDAAPQSAFLLSASQSLPSAEGRLIQLHGLPMKEAMDLAGRVMGRQFDEAERAAVQEICAALQGHPLRIIQTIARAKEEDLPLAQVAQTLKAGEVDERRRWGLLALPEKSRRTLAALAALNGAPVHSQHLLSLAGVDENESAIEDLLRRGFVQREGQAFRLSGDLGEVLSQIWDLSSWGERLVDHFLDWAADHGSVAQEVAAQVEALQAAIDWASELGRWRDLLRLVRSLEGALALSSRWGAWAQMLQSALTAARQAGDPLTQAWALHQLGSRSLALGDLSGARQGLVSALRLREALGDTTGAAFTRHNLKMLLGAPPSGKPPKKPPQKPPMNGGGSAGFPLPTGVTLLALASALLLGSVLAFRVGEALAKVVEGATSQPTFTSSPTALPLPSRTPTAIFTPTPTASDTATPTPSDSPAPTDPPILTDTATWTPTYTFTPTDRPTMTDTPWPTDTPTSTLTLTPTDTPTPTDPAPDPPVDLLVRDSCSDGLYYVAVVWVDQAENEEGYVVFRDGQAIAELEPNSDFFEEWLKKSGRYTYGVLAYNQWGESEMVESVSKGCWSFEEILPTLNPVLPIDPILPIVPTVSSIP